MLKHQTLSSKLTISALGVVFGDIGTSPLYALRVALGGFPIDLFDVLGILSLIFWTLILIISIKYLLIIFRADNNGEGGILALFALLLQKDIPYVNFFYCIAILGAGLLLGDGMLTPAISVISAVEGLSIISKDFNAYILPIASVILLGIFFFQFKGSAKIGAVFGPLILIWFITIALLGLAQILNNPVVLKALHPWYAIQFLLLSGWKGFFILGGIFLVVTGGEALYADMGHFGKNPIRLSWFIIVFPSLVLNYFGQGAYLLLHPQAINNPFFMIAPEWFTVPLVVIAAIATVIASQAVIAATFSLTKQAVLLGLCPRIPIIHTSRHHEGQIYVPQINFILCVGTFLLIFAFKSSDNLAHAYGIAVNCYMLLITTLVVYTAFKVWQWPLWIVGIVFSFFLLIDIAFLIANAHKFLTGGWVPVLFAGFVAFVMYTWKIGLEYLKHNFYLKKEDISKILKQLNYKSLNQLEGVTSIFITDVYDRSGGSFLNFLKLSRAMPEHVLIVNCVVENVPKVQQQHRYTVACLTEKICTLTLHYGFMDYIHLPGALEKANLRQLLPFPINIYTASYIVEVPNIVASPKKRSLLFYLQEKMFAFLMRNYSANLNIEFYNLPYTKTIAIGSYCLL